MAATTTQSSANLESVITLVGSTTPESAVSSTSILAGAGIERSESINFPNADAKLTLGSLAELTKKALSAISSVINHDPTITVSRSQLLVENRMWNAVDSIKQQIGTIASQLTAIKDSHAKIELSNDSSKEQNESAAQAIIEVKKLALGLNKVLQSISEDREEILQIGKESGLREPNFLRKVATCNRAVEAFMSEVVADVGTHDGAQPGRAEIYLAKVVEHVDALEDAKSSIQAVVADSRIGQVKREMAVEFADQFAQKSGAFDSASITTGNFLNDDDILALYDMRNAPESSSADSAKIELKHSNELTSPNESNLINNSLINNKGNFRENLIELGLIHSSIALEEDGDDVLTEEPLAGETIIAGDSATQIETTKPAESVPGSDERELPVRTISGLPANPDHMKAAGPERSNEHPRVSEELAKEIQFITDVKEHLSEIGWDAKKETYTSLHNERTGLQARVDNARAFIEKDGQEKPSYLQRFGSNVKSLFGIGAKKLEQAKSFIAKSAGTLFDLASQESQLLNEFVPEIKQKFAGRTFKLTEENKDNFPAALLKAAVPTRYLDKLVSFEDLRNNAKTLLDTKSTLGEYSDVSHIDGKQSFTVSRFGKDGKIDSSLEIVHSREGRVALFINKPDGTGEQYMGSIWTPKVTEAINSFLEKNDEVFVKRAQKTIEEYTVPAISIEESKWLEAKKIKV